jgi:hypothetical protein
LRSGVIHKKAGSANKRSQRAWRIEHSVIKTSISSIEKLAYSIADGILKINFETISQSLIVSGRKGELR